MVLYTSGTTGRPKGVLHSHNSIHALICQIRDHWLVEPGDKFLVPSPIAHIGGSIYAFECPLLLGTTAVLMDRWNADEAVRLLEAEGCTHMAGATPFLEQMLDGRAARRHAPAEPEAVCLRRRIRAALLDSQRRRRISSVPLSRACMVPPKCPLRRSESRSATMPHMPRIPTAEPAWPRSS